MRMRLLQPLLCKWFLPTEISRWEVWAESCVWYWMGKWSSPAYSLVSNGATRYQVFRPVWSSIGPFISFHRVLQWQRHLQCEAVVRWFLIEFAAECWELGMFRFLSLCLSVLVMADFCARLVLSRNDSMPPFVDSQLWRVYTTQWKR